MTHYKTSRRFFPLNPGRRGATLLTFGSVYLAFSIVIYPTDPVRQGSLFVLFYLLPAQAWQAVWWLAGVNAGIHAFTKRDAWGFVGLELLGAIWAGGQYAAFFLTSNVQAGTFAVVWTLAVVILRIADGWPEVPA